MSTLELAPAAFLAGILMFLAPCTLPIVPGYLAFIAGVREGEMAAKHRIMRNALAFCIGFTIIFVLFGTFAAFLGSHLGTWRYTIARFGGLLLIMFGFIMLGLMPHSLFQGEHHIAAPKWLKLGNAESSAFLGALFALGWSPCIGPILGSILFIASVGTTVFSGALLLFIFSLGLAVPLLLVAALMEKIGQRLVRLASLSSMLQKIGGIILIMLGILMVSNSMGLLVGWGYGIFGSLGYDHLLNYL
jgi:cytochrome c-type biogenesis protein